MKPTWKQIIQTAIDWYVNILAACVTLWCLLIAIFGGYIKSEIHWHTLTDLFI